MNKCLALVLIFALPCMTHLQAGNTLCPRKEKRAKTCSKALAYTDQSVQNSSTKKSPESNNIHPTLEEIKPTLENINFKNFQQSKEKPQLFCAQNKEKIFAKKPKQ